VTQTADPKRLDTTLADVAAEVGLHPSTVSRALDPAKAAMVKEPTRKRILEAAERIGYRPNLAARSLMTGKTSTVAVIAADIGNPWVTPIIHGIAGRMSVEGTVPIIAETSDDSRILDSLLDHMLARRVDAIIVLAARAPDLESIEAAGRLVPTIVAARPLPGVSLPTVRESAEMGGRMVAEHFAGLGHRRVVQLRGPTQVLNFPLRATGFSTAALDAGLDEVYLEDEAILPRFEDGALLAQRLLEGPGDLPTAVFAHNDPMAVGALSVFRERGIDVPGDISICGYNDMPLTGQLTPSLTTVHFPGWEVGHEAADVALRLVAGEDGVTGSELAPTFVPRESTAPPAT
jgi:LacI family transcriptional regulator